MIIDLNFKEILKIVKNNKKELKEDIKHLKNVLKETNHHSLNDMLCEIEELLEFLDSEDLDHFEKCDVIHDIAHQLCLIHIYVKKYSNLIPTYSFNKIMPLSELKPELKSLEKKLLLLVEYDALNIIKEEPF